MVDSRNILKVELKGFVNGWDVGCERNAAVENGFQDFDWNSWKDGVPLYPLALSPDGTT